MRKIKVLHIITRLDRGGSATNTIETVRRLDAKKYTADLISGKSVNVSDEIKAIIDQKQIKVQFIHDLVRNIDPIKDTKAFFQLKKKIKDGRYDIVHTHSSKAGILGRWAAKWAGVKIIIHTPHGHIFYGYFNAFKTKFFIILERITSLITTKMISLTRRGKQEHVNLKIIPENKIVPIYSCIDINRYKPNQPRLEHFYETLNIPKNGFIFGSITRLTPIKGNRYLIDAFAELYKEFPCAYLVLIGDGEEKQKLKNQIDILRLNDNIKLLGWRNDTVELLGFINVFVLASLNEGMGRAVLEAMACGKPVIATKVGGIPELVIHDQTGMLVAPANSDELSTAMRQLLTDREKMKKFSRAGMNRISKQFSLEKMIQDIDQLYGELLKENT